MKNNISIYLDQYLAMKNPGFAVMLNGEWGCGKTYFIKQKIKEWEDKENYRVNYDELKLKPIYVSLNGTKSIEEITHLIKKSLNPILYSKGVKTLQKIIGGAFQIVSKTAFDFNKDEEADDLSNCLDFDGILDIIFKTNDKIKGNKILIFDDLERCLLPTIELFGYINNFVEHSDMRVILLCNEEFLPQQSSDKDIDYRIFKEKLIGQTFTLHQNVKEVLESLFKEYEYDFLIQNKYMFIDIVKASQKQNFRIIKQCILDLKRLLEEIDTKEYNKERLELFIKSFMFYFVFVYIEYKSGNLFVKKYNTFTVGLPDDEKEEVENLERKYLPVSHKYNIERIEQVVNIDTIIKYIDNGFMENLDEMIQSNKIVNLQKSSDWEDLYFYWTLDNETFTKKVENIKQQIFSTNIESVPIILHIYGILLDFRQKKIIRINLKKLKRTVKQQIDNLYTKENLTDDQIFVEFHGTSFNKKYYCYDSDEMTEMLEYAKVKQNRYYKDKDRQYCLNFWNKLSSADFHNIYLYFEQKTASGYSYYKYTPIFEACNVNHLVREVIKLDNQQRNDFTNFLIYRYHITDGHYNSVNKEEFKNDIPILKSVKEHLERKINRQQKINKVTLNRLISILEIIVNEDNQ